MTNLEKLIEILKTAYPNVPFVPDEIMDELEHTCMFISCDNQEFDEVCKTSCRFHLFWDCEYIYPKTGEYNPKFHTGYMVMVEDDGHFISYSGCIHPSYSNAMEEVDNAEYHGWNAHIKSVEFVMKGGEWKNA